MILVVDPMLLPSGNPIKCHNEALSLLPMIQAHRVFYLCFAYSIEYWYNGGFLPDMILFVDPMLLPSENPINAIKRLCLCCL